MKQGYKNIFLTGEPGSGKSTLLKKLIASVGDKVGFVTEQVLDKNGDRESFNIVDNYGNVYLLASKIEQSQILFADKYYIHPLGLESIIQNFQVSVGDLIYIDEIAPMQLYTPGFEHFISNIFDLPNPILGIIKLDDTHYPFIQAIKKRKDTLIVDLSDGNNYDEFLSGFVKKVSKSQKYIKEPERYTQINQNLYSMISSSNTRTISIHEDGLIVCNCDFYNQYGVCSHTIGLRQII